MSPRTWKITLACGALLLVMAVTVFSYLRAASVLLASIKAQDPTGLTKLVEAPVKTRDVELVSRGEHIAARIYQPSRKEPLAAVLLVHGIHPRGIDEPRFVSFAMAMARVGNVVMTPSLPELASLEATPSTIARIAAAASALCAESKRDVIVIGISVGGGLSLLAAARQHGQTPIARVVTVGAHDNLVRIAQHYAGITATDISGRKSTIKPHPYGIQVMIYAHADHVFNAEDFPIARKALALYLSEHYREAVREARKLSQEGQALMNAVFRDPTGPIVAARLRDAIEQVQGALHAVSPDGKLNSLQIPVMLLHGQTDPVIPATELSWLEHEIPRGLVEAALVTPVLTHADFPEGVGTLDYLRILHFASQMLDPP